MGGGGGGGPPVGGRGRVGLAAVVELKPQVVPDHAGSDIAGGHGEGDGVLAGLEQRGVELLDVLVPDALVGVVAQSVGGDGVQGADFLAVDADGQVAGDAGRGAVAAVGSGQGDAQDGVTGGGAGHGELLSSSVKEGGGTGRREDSSGTLVELGRRTRLLARPDLSVRADPEVAVVGGEFEGWGLRRGRGGAFGFGGRGAGGGGALCEQARVGGWNERYFDGAAGPLHRNWLPGTAGVFAAEERAGGVDGELMLGAGGDRERGELAGEGGAWFGLP